MDNIIISYLVKASISIALFYGVYMLFLRTDTFLKLRRFYFLFAIAFSLVFPAFNIEIPVKSEATVQIPTYWLSDMDLNLNPGITENEASQISIWTIILVGLSIISVIYALKFIIQLFSVVKLRIDNESEKRTSYCIVKMKDRAASPFSFFRWIFINSEDHSMQELEEIIAHEQVHVKQLHSIDTILSELLCVIFWWNPFVWFIKKEIRINLEYLADQGVLKAGYNPKQYQYILLQVSNKNTLGLPIINNFNISQLKKRIAMMNREDSPVFTSFKYLLIIPLGMMLLLGNAVQANSDLIDISPAEFLSDNKQTDQPDPVTEIVKQEKVTVKEVWSEKMPSTTKPETIHKERASEKESDNIKPFVTAEKMPQYPGGETQMQQFIRDNLKYPVTAQEKGIQGRVTLRFVVNPDGKISNITVVRGIDPHCDAEAVRVIEQMPKWIAGQQKGNPVPVFFNLPIQFRLQS